MIMGKNTPGNPSERSDTCSWSIDDALRSLQDADEKIREFLEKKKKGKHEIKGSPMNPGKNIPAAISS